MSYSTPASYKILSRNYSPASNTATVNEELLHSHQISAQEVLSGDMLEVFSSWVITNSANAKTFRVYINTANTLVGATQLGTFNPGAVQSENLSRYMPAINDTTLEVYGNATTSARNQFANSAAQSVNIAVPSLSAGFWILFSGQKAAAGETCTIRWSMVRNSKP